MNELFSKWKKIKDKKIQSRLSKMTEKEIDNNFSSFLEFGTAGMRGTMELGTNNINEITCSNLAQSLATYCKQNLFKKVVVCFDTRLNSKKFSRIFAKVLDFNGIEVLLFKNFAPTPICVFATVNMNADFGVMITASHNNKTYNGIKIYSSNGIQINKQVQESVSKIFKETDEVESYNNVLNYKLKHTQLLGRIVENKFCEYAKEKSKQQKDIKVVYTPLNGTGFYCAKKVLKKQHFKFYSPNSQKKPSGYFITCPYPNPEFQEAFDESIILAKKVDADIIIATDPDADRLGVMVKKDNSYYKLSGNEVGYIFLEYMLSNSQSQDKFIVSSVVSSPLATTICKAYKAKLYRTLTGFMSIGTKANECVRKFGKNAYILAYEESCGYILRKDYFDKDGIFAMLKFCEIARELKKKNKTVIDFLDEIYDKYGYMSCIGDSIVYEGINAKQKMQKVVNNLRENPPTMILDKKIIKVVDYENDETGLDKQNFLEFKAKDISFIIRPSGTEPKLKIYEFVKGKSKVKTDELACEILKEIKGKILK